MKIRTLSLVSATAVGLSFPMAAHANSGAAEEAVAGAVPMAPTGLANGASAAALEAANPAKGASIAAPGETSDLTETAMLAAAADLRSRSVTYTAPQEFKADAAPLTAIDLAKGAPSSVETLVALAANMTPEQAAQAQSVLAAVQYSGSTSQPEERSDSYSVFLNQDAFFGFYPSFNGLIPIGDNIDFSFYGILWTTPSFASTAIAGGGSSGSDLWTEFGAGVAIHTMEGNLVIKPQLGITNGALLSGGVLDGAEAPTGTGGNFADGIVPSLTMNYSDDSFEAEFYGGYYAALRNRNDAPALDFLHTWINAGAKLNSNFSLGAHYELLSNTRNNSGPTSVVYQWLGPYVQFATDNGFFARFSAGADIESGGDGDFYKLTAGFSF